MDINLHGHNIFNCTFFICNIDKIKNFLSGQEGFILGNNLNIEYVNRDIKGILTFINNNGFCIERN